MTLVLTVLETVAPVFLLGAAGFLWVKAGFEYRVEFVTRLAMTLALPCLVFVALMRTEIAPQAIASVALAAAAAYGAVTVAFLALVRLSGLDRRTWLSPLIFGNTGNLGLPLALFAFGQPGLELAVVVFAVMILWNFTFGLWVVAGGGDLRRIATDPLLLATLAGGVFLWNGWQTPQVITNTLELAGQMAIPMMLLTLGVAVARLRPRGLGRAVALSALKLAVCLGAAWAVGRGFGLDRLAFAVLVLQVSTPVAVTSYLIAERYGTDPEAVAGLVVVSTLLSVLAIPLTLALVM